MPRTPRSPTTPLRARTIVLLLLLLAAGQAMWAAGADAAAVSGSGDPHEWDERSLAGISPNGTDTHGSTVEVKTTTDADGRHRMTGSRQDAQDAGVREGVSGACPVAFSVHGLPLGSRFTTPEDPAPTRALDSGADPRTGRASVSARRRPTDGPRVGFTPDHLRAGDRPRDGRLMRGYGSGGAHVPPDLRLAPARSGAHPRDSQTIR